MNLGDELLSCDWQGSRGVKTIVNESQMEDDDYMILRIVLDVGFALLKF